MPGYLFIGLGVARPQGLDPLPGMANSIADMTKWAKGEGYQIVSITDETHPVTAPRINTELTAALKVDLDRIVLYFVGHGFLSYPDQIWILSDGPDVNSGRVSRDTLRGSLATYHPRQISVISDACLTSRYFPTGTVPVLMDRPGKGSRVFIDGFYSTLPNGLAFGANPAPLGKPFCLFTSVLSDFLSGKDERAFKLATGKLPHVTTQTLLYSLPDAVLERGSNFGVDQELKIEPGFRWGEDIYSRFEPHGAVPPVPAEELYRSGQPPPVDPHAPIKSIEPDLSEINADHRLPDLPKELSHRIYGCSALVFRAGGPGVSDLKVTGKPAISLTLEPVFDGTGVWLPVTFTDLGDQLELMTLSWGTGRRLGYCMAPRYRGLVAMIGISGGFESSPECSHLSWVPEYRLHDFNRLTRSAYWVIDQLTTGNLHSRDVRAIADGMRFDKHANPLLGVACAYLYDLIGDTDSISRLCYFYRSHDQAIPFDIALLSRGDLVPAEKGWNLTYPAASEDGERKSAGVPEYLWRKTDGGVASVGGAVPLLRVGWSRLNAHTNPMLRRFGQLQSALSPSPIATLIGDDARRMANMLLRDIGIQVVD